MADIFSTNVMLHVVNSLLAPPQFLLDRFFPEVQTETSEEIHFDLIDKTRRLAPFVSPVVAGKVVQSRGFTTQTFKPAYIKDKRIFESNRPFKRSAGEPIGGTLHPGDRMRLLAVNELVDQMEMIGRRLEVMAAETLRTGAVTIEGELYPVQHVDFQRDTALSIALAGAARWNQPNVNPLDDLQDWAQIILQKSGSIPSDVVMTVDVWKVFRENLFVKSRLELLRGNSTMTQAAQIAETAVSMGQIDGFNIFVYAGWYLGDDNTEQLILPPGTVLLGSQQIKGVRAFGAIRDEEAGFQAVPYYPKS